MKTWIALIRGINVGGRHKVPMKALVAAMEKDGFANVRTYIQSGNVVYDSPSGRREDIAQLIEDGFGFRPEVFVLGKADLERAMGDNPYAKAAEGRTVHFFFCDRAPKAPDVDLLESLRAPTERWELIGKVFYLHAPDGIARSKLVDKLGKAIAGVTMTARNLNTINKLREMVG